MTESDFLEKYGDVKVKFHSYYKYSFNFMGTLEDGSTITVSVGGNSDDIYRFNVTADEEITVDSLYPYAGEVIKDCKTVEDFYNY